MSFAVTSQSKSEHFNAWDDAVLAQVKKINKRMTLAIDLLEIMQTPKDSSKIASHQYGNVSADKQLFKHLTQHTIGDCVLSLDDKSNLRQTMTLRNVKILKS